MSFRYRLRIISLRSPLLPPWAPDDPFARDSSAQPAANVPAVMGDTLNFWKTRRVGQRLSTL